MTIAPINLGASIAEHLMAARATKDSGSIEFLDCGAQVKLLLTNVGIQVYLEAVRVAGEVDAVVVRRHPD